MSDPFEPDDEDIDEYERDREELVADEVSEALKNEIE